MALLTLPLPPPRAPRSCWRRRERGHETLGQCALALRLVVAKALRRMGRLDEAEMHFKVLAGESA